MYLYYNKYLVREVAFCDGMTIDEIIDFFTIDMDEFYSTLDWCGEWDYEELRLSDLIPIKVTSEQYPVAPYFWMEDKLFIYSIVDRVYNLYGSDNYYEAFIPIEAEICIADPFNLIADEQIIVKHYKKVCREALDLLFDGILQNGLEADVYLDLYDGSVDYAFDLYYDGSCMELIHINSDEIENYYYLAHYDQDYNDKPFEDLTQDELEDFADEYHYNTSSTYLEIFEDAIDKAIENGTISCESGFLIFGGKEND